jgi:hypothetical protein
VLYRETLSQKKKRAAVTLVPKVHWQSSCGGAKIQAGWGSPVVLVPGEQVSHLLFPPPQLWYFWRRRLFIWISFMDSYFEILLYVGFISALPLSLRPERGRCGRGHQSDFRGEDTRV